VAGGFALDNSGDANQGHDDFALARYNLNGTLDTSFGLNGRVVIDFTSVLGLGGAAINCLVLQGDGKIVVAGSAFDRSIGLDDFAVARFNADGNPDTTFGPNNNGLVATNIMAAASRGLGDSSANALVLQNDGKIVVAGSSVDPVKGLEEFALARYTVAGRLDGTFNTSGVVLTDFGAGNFEFGGSASAVALSGNEIVAAGFAAPDRSTGGERFALARYTAFGQLDTSFGGTGKVTTQINDFDEAKAVAVQSDGKIVAAGFSEDAVAIAFAAARYNPDGSLDSTFGPAGPLPGVATTSFFQPPDHDEASAVALQPDGKIVAVGFAIEPNGDSAFAVTCYLAATGTVQLSTPPLPPPAHRAVFAELVPVRMGRKTRWMVEVLYADTGAVKFQFLSPFQQPAFHGIQVSTVEGNGAGVPDQVILTGRRGRRFVNLDIPV
jgi:uncharacterized delta-60 repeat protein